MVNISVNVPRPCAVASMIDGSGLCFEAIVVASVPLDQDDFTGLLDARKAQSSTHFVFLRLVRWTVGMLAGDFFVGRLFVYSLVQIHNVPRIWTQRLEHGNNFMLSTTLSKPVFIFCVEGDFWVVEFWVVEAFRLRR